MELDLGGAQIGHRAGALADLDDGARFLGAGGKDATRTVVLEAAPDHSDVGSEQR